MKSKHPHEILKQSGFAAILALLMSMLFAGCGGGYPEPDSVLLKSPLLSGIKTALSAENSEPDPMKRAAFAMKAAGLYLEQGREPSACRKARDALFAHPAHGPALVFLANCYERRGIPGMAMALRQTCGTLPPKMAVGSCDARLGIKAWVLSLEKSRPSESLSARIIGAKAGPETSVALKGDALLIRTRLENDVRIIGWTMVRGGSPVADGAISFVQARAAAEKELVRQLSSAPDIRALKINTEPGFIGRLSGCVLFPYDLMETGPLTIQVNAGAQCVLRGNIDSGKMEIAGKAGVLNGRKNNDMEKAENHLAGGRRADAVRLLDDFSKRSGPSEAQAMADLRAGGIRALMQKKAEARSSYERAIKSSHLLLVRSEAMIGLARLADKENSLRIYREIAKLYPGSTAADEAKRRCKSAGGCGN